MKLIGSRVQKQEQKRERNPLVYKKQIMMKNITN